MEWIGNIPPIIHRQKARLVHNRKHMMHIAKVRRDELILRLEIRQLDLVVDFLKGQALAASLHLRNVELPGRIKLLMIVEVRMRRDVPDAVFL